MSNNKKDSIDEMLDEVHNNGYDNTNVSDFERIVSKAVNSTVKSVNSAVKEKGYDSFSEMISEEISIGLNSNKAPAKPNVSLYATKNATTRYEFFMSAIENVTYDSRYRGNFKNGHVEAVDRYIDKIELNKQNLSVVEKTLKQEINACGRRGFGDSYDRGYVEGLKLVEKVLLNSKVAMMSRVADKLKEAFK